ncbi:MAG: flagellar hook-basal body complex protein [Lachnospiraceae bacterium]|nr:flagellar hook-basal body complex protein [Lachnospiraceae bacterium]
MMRSLFSGVAGLKTHQTKMDVIGNNIANVNTVGYKSQSIVFADLMYQTTQSASGPNAVTGAGGINARQIGLGVKSAAINTAITTPGSTQTTGNPFDLKINGDAFFIVNNGTENFFTRDGSFYVDAAGNLAMTSNGYNVMGWQVDEETGKAKKDTVSALRIMSEANMTYPAEATTEAYISGYCDKNDSDINSSHGKIMNLSFYDALGYSYTAKLSVHRTADDGVYYTQLDDILDSNNQSLKEVYGVDDISDIANLGREITVNVNDAVSYNGDCVITKNPRTLTSEGLTAAAIPNGVTAPANATDLEGNAVTLTQAVLDSAGNVQYFVDGNGNLYNESGAALASTTIKTITTGAPVILGDGTTVPAGSALDLTPGQTYVDANGDAIEIDLTQGGTVANELKAIYGEDAFEGVNKFKIDPETGKLIITNKNVNGCKLTYNTSTGKFDNIDGGNSVILDFETGVATTGANLGNFSDINIDFSGTSQENNGGVATLGGNSGTLASKGALGCGRKVGDMTGVSISQNGEIYASYDNGMSKLLGQIAVATFANASGLEKQGDNLYSATQNSGDFDGIGQDITADGTGSITTGALEMSNVDLSSEFTEMITTQRGFQANSRIITVSDTLLEELTNLKR